MPSITTWTRLEPGVTGAELNETLKARIFDPLWLLARQWQLGEMHGEDNGTPVSARLRGECAQLSRYLPGPIATNPPKGTKFDPRQVPLETLVEREAVHPAPGAIEQLRVSAEAGQQFLRLLAQAPFSTKYHPAFISHFPMPARAAAEAAAADRDSLRFLELMSGRVPCGAKLYSALKQPALPAALTIDPADLTAVRTAGDAFIRWYDQLFSEPAGVPEAWSPARMEYCFSVAAPSTPETVLASEYYQGDLDWYDFDVKPGATIGAVEDRVMGQNPLPITRTTIPAPVTYRGMPAPRWWEFEDAAVDFGAVDAQPEDLARMLLVEFAITYGNDWFVIPVDVPVGSVCKVNSLVLTDTFGVRTLIPSIGASSHPASASWRMFRNSTDRTGAPFGIPQGSPETFFLAPTLMRTIEGKPIEEVFLLRDEMANLAWGVERLAEGTSGRPVNRREQDLDQRRQEPSVPSTSEDGTLAWHLATEVPDYWIPLIPIQIQAGQGAIRFRRGATLRPDGSLRPQTARSRILKPGTGPLDIFEEEIPREGARVTRSYQYARWLDGSPLLWIGRRKAIGRGEGSSGLRFDVVE